MVEQYKNVGTFEGCRKKLLSDGAFGPAQTGSGEGGQLVDIFEKIIEHS